jgi:hypothetical protein
MGSSRGGDDPISPLDFPPPASPNNSSPKDAPLASMVTYYGPPLVAEPVRSARKGAAKKPRRAIGDKEMDELVSSMAVHDPFLGF